MGTVRHSSEADLQAFAVDYLRMRGWLVAHFRPARTDDGWRTAGSYDAKGFPDLAIARGGVVRLIEVKGPKGRLTRDQHAWLDASRGDLLTPRTDLDDFMEAFA